MTVDEARHWLIKFSLGITAAHFAFLLIAPVWLAYPLRMNEAIRLVEIVIPVFLGYLGTATRFLFRHQGTSSDHRDSLDPTMLRLLVKWPPLLFAIVSIGAFSTFWRANRSDGPGMLPDTLGIIITANLGILAVTTNVVVANLFEVQRRRSKASRRGVNSE